MMASESPLPVSDGPGDAWEYQVFSDRMYGQLRYRVDEWSARWVPPPEVVRRIDLAAKRLVSRVARSGWEPAEAIDGMSLWRAGRVDLEVSEVSPGLLHDTRTVGFRQIRLRCRRRVSDRPMEHTG